MKTLVITLAAILNIVTACSPLHYTAGEHKQNEINAYRTNYSYIATKLIKSTNEVEQVQLRTQLEELKQQHLHLFQKQ